MTKLFPDFMDQASLTRIARGDVGALRASVAALDARIQGGATGGFSARLDALKERHAALEARIFDEDQRPRPDSDTLMRLKIEKLRLRQEMEDLGEKNGNPETAIN